MGGCVSLDLSCDQTLNQTCNCLFGDGNYIHMMKANLEALETTMQELRQRRDDLLTRVSTEEDKGLQRLAQVEGWLSRVARIDSQVSDLLKDEPTETKRLCLFVYCSTKCISSCEYGKKVSKKLEEVKELLSRKDFEKVAEKRPAPKVGKKHIQTTIGLDSMVEKAWNSIMKPERRTLGIYGMGGVGKTTLLTHINNKLDKEVNGFDVVIWVVVSQDLQYKGIQDQILRRLRVDKEWENQTEEEKASSIDDILGRKKFVLLLDDLWSEVDLNKIGVPRPTQENGSKIVFTTRSKEVCSDMEADDKLQIDCLPANEAWELFRSIVGEDTLKLHQDIPTLAKKICEKCYGLPLALNVIGKAMKYKEDVHEWRHAKKVLSTSSHEFPGMEEKILSILKFSYDGLKEENVKSCFLYCSLFPEDYEIKKEELIEYWINEGFINGKRDEDGSNNQGHVIIGSLVRAHLLMESETTVKMHDVLREMALWIGSTSAKEEEKQCVKSGVKLSCIPDDINWSVSRRISLMSNQIEKISCCPECPNLSTLFLQGNNLEGIPGEFFQFMKALVVLDLSHNLLWELPEEICSLTSLQCLSLSFTFIRSLSVGLKGLRKLISLDLEWTSLTSIDGIGTSLPNLQVLKLYHSRVYIDARSIEELQLLEHLKILTGNVKDALILESIQRVERLASCVQRLLISGVFAEVITLNTAALGGLRGLEIWYSQISEIKIDWKSKEKEDLLCNSSPYFRHLSSIFIYDLEGPKELTWLLFAPNLKHLHVRSARSRSVEEIINKEKGMSISNVHPDMTVPFRTLESLTLERLPELKRICSSPPPALPSLKIVLVEKCPKLPEAAIREFQRHEQE
ncbi:probable disease resistance protein At1g15890 [Brassica rapa]|uniref:probable disease resistance protein At1g15890 n=1 Tax=Brassica campestris TaxID=3711 RepID=UPI00142E8DDE|nr:probable disease resistance protein At1g15890 [Brassica rapa]